MPAGCLAAGWLFGSQMLDDVLSFANSEGGRVITVTQTRLRLRLRLRLSESEAGGGTTQ